MKQLVKLVFLLMGVLLLAWAIQKVDMGSVAALLLQMGWGFIAVILAYGLVSLASRSFNILARRWCG